MYKMLELTGETGDHQDMIQLNQNEELTADRQNGQKINTFVPDIEWGDVTGENGDKKAEKKVKETKI